MKPIEINNHHFTDLEAAKLYIRKRLACYRIGTALLSDSEDFLFFAKLCLRDSNLNFKALKDIRKIHIVRNRRMKATDFEVELLDGTKTQVAWVPCLMS